LFEHQTFSASSTTTATTTTNTTAATTATNFSSKTGKMIFKIKLVSFGLEILISKKMFLGPFDGYLHLSEECN
jgi:hypothetical protein